MSVSVAKDQFDWRGPASMGRPKPLTTRLKELCIPPPGEKVLPTASGMTLILIGLCIGLAAYNTENNILFAALSLLVALIVVSGLFCWMNFLCARWRLETSSTFRVGETGEVAVVVENARQGFPLYCLQFDLDSEETEESHPLFLKDSLEPGRTCRLVWRYRPRKRCVTDIRIFDAVSSFPFGFLRKHVAGECSQRVRVWPERIEYRRLKAPGGGFGWQGASTKRKGSTGELIGLRHYIPGDAPRSIHWKVTARQGELMVKQNAAESQARYSMVVDPSRSFWSNGMVFEKMCSFAVSLAEDLFLAGDLNYCRVIGGSTIKISRVADLESFFDEVAEIEMEGRSGEDREANYGNAITFSQLDSKSVGAIINGVTIAKA